MAEQRHTLEICTKIRVESVFYDASLSGRGPLRKLGKQQPSWFWNGRKSLPVVRQQPGTCSIKWKMSKNYKKLQLRWQILSVEVLALTPAQDNLNITEHFE